MNMISIIGVVVAGTFVYYAFKERWGLAFGAILVGAVAVMMVEDPGSTIIPLGKYLWNAALEAVGLG